MRSLSAPFRLFLALTGCLLVVTPGGERRALAESRSQAWEPPEFAALVLTGTYRPRPAPSAVDGHENGAPRGTEPAEPRADGVIEGSATPAPDLDGLADVLAAPGRPSDPSNSPAYDVVITPEVEYFLDQFTGARRELVALWLSRAGRYLDMIRETLRSEGLPQDLAFVPLVESGYNPLAVSRAGAKGLWQFMPGTARHYGLRVDRWVDERLDPEKSTMAAAAYLGDLYRQFGSWSLVKAAYNAGAMKVERALRAAGSSDFEAIAKGRFLQRETKRFVPAVHAAIVIGRDPERYGFDRQPEEPRAVESVDVPPAMSLKTVATAGVPLETLRALNPALIRGVTPPNASYAVKVPPGARARVLALLQILRARGVEAGVHLVRRGETVWEIAHEHGVSVAEVVRWNRLRRPELIQPGDRLRVVELPLTAGAGQSPPSR